MPGRVASLPFPLIAKAAELRHSGAVLLLSCYELGHPPAGLTWPSAFLRRAGFDPEVVDLAVQTLDAGQVSRASLAAVSVPMHTALRLGVEASRAIRRLNPACHVCFFGLYAWLNSEFLIESGVADTVIGGECEAPLVELASALEKGAPLPPYVGGPGRSQPARLVRSDFPVPSRQGMAPLSSYARLLHQAESRLAGYVEATRGCLKQCRHCPVVPVYQGKLIVVPRAVVLEDIGRQVAAGAKHITFGDPDFLNAPAHSMRIVRAMQGRFPDLTFDFTAKVEHIVRHQRLLPEMRRLGCLFVTTAVESLSERVLSRLAKGHTRGDVLYALRVAREADVALRPTWVPFTPWTRLQDYVEMLDFIRDEGLVPQVDAVQYSMRLLVPPGSELLRDDTLVPFLSGLDAAAFTYRWIHPDPVMEALYHSVVEVVNQGARTGERVEQTFRRVRRLARQALDPEWAEESWPEGVEGWLETPRLTESWFC